MTKVFVDASVLIAAAISETSAARELLRYSFRGKAELVISPLVLEETRRNLAKKAPAALPFFDLFIQVVPFVEVTPSAKEIREVAQTFAEKDAPIIAAARKADVDFLATWDREHLLNAKEATERWGVIIASPDEVLAALREQG